ncbi:MAG: MFS transporter [Pseudomonadota bacterium]
MSSTRALTPLQLIAYGLPGFPLAVLTLPVYIFIPTFYGETLGVDLGAIALILAAVRIMDAVTDPLAGRLSDATRSPLGRRKPWLIFAAPAAILSVYMLFVPPAEAGAAHLALWSVLLSLSWTAMLLPYNAWGAEITGDYFERNKVTAAREICVLLGTVAAASLPALVGQSEATGDGLGDALRLLAIGVAIVLPLTVAAAVFFAPDRPDLTARRISLREGLQAMRENGPFRRLIFAYIINATANGLPATLFLFFVSYRLGLDEMEGPLLGLYFLAGLVGAPFWVWLARRMGKDRAWTIAMAWACAIFLLALFVDGPEDLWLFVAVSALSGLALGADLILPASIQADVVDLDTLNCGRQRTGLFFALWSLATKGALAFAVFLAFGTLELAGFEASPEANNGAAALWTLSGLYALLPVALKLWAMKLMWRFPIDAAEQTRIRREIEARAERAVG